MSLLLAALLAAPAPEPCSAVRRDHEAFKRWANAEMPRLKPARPGAPKDSERKRWAAFETEVEARITSLNKRYGACRND